MILAPLNFKVAVEPGNGVESENKFLEVGIRIDQVGLDALPSEYYDAYARPTLGALLALKLVV